MAICVLDVARPLHSSCSREPVLAILAGIVTPIAGALYNRVGGRWLIFAGSILLAINTWELAHLTPETSYTAIMVIVAIRGIALGLVLQTTLTTALTGLKPVQLPRAISLLNESSNVFQSFDITILGTIVANQFTSSLQAAVNDIPNSTTSLGQQFNPIEQALVQQGLSAAIAAKAVMGKLLAQIFDPHAPIFQMNFNSARVS
jgi:DHA2 family multidrug resistance protein